MSGASHEHPTQLSAIVFTDIVGYSRMMEGDEERTIGILKRHNDIVLPLIDRAAGEVIDAIGDGLFILFPSVREAVVCSVAIHEAIEAHNAEAAEPERFHLRIGVHLGEVWREGDRVYGNGVNVAARVQPLAKPGGICITEDVYRQVSNKLSHEIRPIGRRELRNISRRIELYQVVTGHERGEDKRDTGHGEIDAIKQRILQEREKVARRLQAGTEPDAQSGESGGTAGSTAGSTAEAQRRGASGSRERSFENAIESKVFSLVERVMDTAISKWDEMPEEKKSKAMARIQRELANEGDHDVHAGPARVEIHGDNKDEGEGADLASRFGTGLVFGAGFGLGYFYFGIGWMIWPFIILGVLPFAAGLLKWLKTVAKNERRRRDRPRELESTLLRVAGRSGGKVTVVQAASQAELPLDEVQETLDRMTAKGYVIQNVLESGVIEYEFPSLATARRNPDAGGNAAPE
jgi:class 3 adenylate cyclase/F0F1-type ATP synthase assembly protein I